MMLMIKATLTILLLSFTLGSCDRRNHDKFTQLLKHSLNGFQKERHTSSKLNQMYEKMLPHLLKTRQTEDDDVCLIQALPLLCQQGGYYQQQVDLAADCGMSLAGALDQAAKTCSIKSDGESCYSITDSVELISNAQTQCLRGVEKSANKCPPGCADALHSLQTRGGCCVSLLNDSDVSNPLLANSLWSACGVPTISQCKNTVTVPTKLLPGYRAQCSDEEFEERTFELMCSNIWNRVIRRLDSLSVCRSVIRIIMETCFVNSERKFCDLINSGDELFSQISNNCAQDQPSCSPVCAQLLETARNDYGCCLNTRFNGTEETSQVGTALTDKSLWEQCGVETPPLVCESLLTGGGTRMATMSAIVMAVSAFLVAMLNI